MSEYEETVRSLAKNNKTARNLRREIRKMDMSEITKFLADEGLNATGSEAESRERYWRYKLRQTDIGDEVPWNPHTDLANLKAKVGNLPMCEDLWQQYVPRTKKGSATGDVSDSSLTDTEKGAEDTLTKTASLGLAAGLFPVRSKTLAVSTVTTTSITTTTASGFRNSGLGVHNFSDTPLISVGDDISSHSTWGHNTKNTVTTSASDRQQRPPHLGLPNVDSTLAMQQRMAHIEDMLMRLTARLDGNETPGARANKPNNSADKNLRERKDKSTLRSSSDSEDDRNGGRRDGRSRHSTRYDRTDCVKLLKSHNLQFSGNANEDAEDFLLRLQIVLTGSEYSDDATLHSLMCVFRGDANNWYITSMETMKSWRDFVRQFRSHYCKIISDEALSVKLHSRLQEKGETMARYIHSLKLITRRFKNPPTEAALVPIIEKHMLPEYRRFMALQKIESLDDLIKFGRRLEELKEDDANFNETAASQKSKKVATSEQSSAANSKAAAKIASVEVKTTLSHPSPSKLKRKRGSRGGVKHRKNSSSSSSSECAEVALASTKSWRPATSANKNQLPPSFANNAGKTWDNRPPPSPNMQQNRFVGMCHVCKQVGHRAPDCQMRSCFQCGNLGHFATNCPNRQPRPQNQWAPQRQQPWTPQQSQAWPALPQRQGAGWQQNVSQNNNNSNSLSCQVCETPNVVFANCHKCAPMREMMKKSGNMNAGV